MSNSQRRGAISSSYILWQNVQLGRNLSNYGMFRQMTGNVRRDNEKSKGEEPIKKQLEEVCRWDFSNIQECDSDLAKEPLKIFRH